MCVYMCVDMYAYMCVAMCVDIRVFDMGLAMRCVY